MTGTIDVANRFYAAVARGDMDAAGACIDAERFTILEADDLPFGGVYRGLRGFQDLLSRMRELWKRAAVADLILVADGDTTIARLNLDVISRRTGARRKLPLVEICMIEEGRIVQVQPYYFNAAEVWAVAGIERPGLN